MNNGNSRNESTRGRDSNDGDIQPFGTSLSIVAQKATQIRTMQKLKQYRNHIFSTGQMLANNPCDLMRFL